MPRSAAGISSCPGEVHRHAAHVLQHVARQAGGNAEAQLGELGDRRDRLLEPAEAFRPVGRVQERHHVGAQHLLVILEIELAPAAAHVPAELPHLVEAAAGAAERRAEQAAGRMLAGGVVRPPLARNRSTPLLTASRISNGLTIAPLVSTSICRRPPDILFTFEAKLLSSVMCGVPAGFALCIFQRNCGACAFTSTVATVVAGRRNAGSLDEFTSFHGVLLGFCCCQLSRSEHHVRQNQNDLREEVEDQHRDPLQAHEGKHSLVDLAIAPIAA